MKISQFENMKYSCMSFVLWVAYKDWMRANSSNNATPGE